ncbi:MAG: ABC transporter permease [Parabacteroides sp.]|nr:ABC transporter permease [Parabacteroides sp.]
MFCFALCTYLIRYWMNEDNAFKNKKQIAEMIFVQNNGYPVSGTPATLGIELQNKQLPMIERITRATYNKPENLSFEISEDKTLPYQLHVIETDTNFISVFDRQLLHGNFPTVNKQTNTLLLSQSTAMKIYGNENPTGKKVIDKNQKAYTIGGVFEDFPSNNSISTYEPIEVLIISVLNGFLEQERKGVTRSNTYILLHPEYKPDDLEKLLRSINYTSEFGDEPVQVYACPLGEMKYRNTEYKLFYGFIFLLGLLIFLSALLNYFSFTTGNFYNRIKEFSIRKGIGENRIHLFTLLFTETFLSLLFTGTLALCLNELFVPGLQFSFFRIQLEFDSYLLSGQIIEYLLFCIVLSAIICGTVCIRLNKISLIEGIRFSRHRVRNTLLGIQYFIALFFLSGAAAATFQTWTGRQQLFSSLTNGEKERIFFCPYQPQIYEVYLPDITLQMESEQHGRRYFGSSG